MNKIVKIVQNERLWLESIAIDQLKKIAELKGIIKAVGLPDLHPGKTPVGASFVTKDIIYPHIIGNDIGCGMALFSTNIKKKKFKIDKIMKKLEKIDTLENIETDIKTNLEINIQTNHLGTIGGGNHFAEFQQVNEIYDENAFEKIGMYKDNIYLLVHSGSRNYGEYILRKYIENHSCQNGIDINTEVFLSYMEEHNKAMQYGALNREIVASKLLSLIGGKDSTKLLDSIHNSITLKEVDGETYYIHRKGAAPSDVGYIVIAGNRGSKSYIVEPTDNLSEYAFSISHGAGRKWSRSTCKGRLESKCNKKFNLICKNKNLFYEEAPEAYKNIESVIKAMVDEKMIKVVASLQPLLTYKG